MAYANMESTPTLLGRGRFVVSEGVAPSEKILPDEDLPTLFAHETGAGDEFFDIVLLKGTIISAYQKTDGRYVATYCRGTAGCDQLLKVVGRDDGHVEFIAVNAANPSDPDHIVDVVFNRKTSDIVDNTPNIMGEAGTDGVAGSLGQAAKPIGVLAKDAFRPFSKGDNEGVSFITRGYVEWPLVKIEQSNNSVIFDNTDLLVGDYVKSDSLGRPVKFSEGVDPEWLRIGQVIAREDLKAMSAGAWRPTAAADYDFGYLQWMQLPVDFYEQLALREIYGQQVFGVSADVFGVRPNVTSSGLLEQYKQVTGNSPAADEAYGGTGVYGAVRVNLINM